VSSIRATPNPDGSFDVEVREGAITTSHTVTVPPRLPETLGWAAGRESELVRQSFEFLLEREPATSILRRFSLDVIGDYFPDYTRVMTRRADETH
jgi:bifunctional DNA-binding transcriptional regulator/antitoxin component of YhaV-PrlF toxin-antitoxin module